MGFYTLRDENLEFGRRRGSKDKKKRKTGSVTIGGKTFVNKSTRRSNLVKTAAKVGGVGAVGAAGLYGLYKAGKAGARRGAGSLAVGKQMGYGRVANAKMAAGTVGRGIARDANTARKAVANVAAPVTNRAKAGAAYVSDRAKRARTDMDIRRRERNSTIMR